MDRLAIAVTPELVSTPDPEWNAKLIAWLHRQALSEAQEKIGPLQTAYNEAGLVEFELEAEFGKGWRGKADAKARYKPAFERLRAAEEMASRDYYQPQTEAAVALAMHPAPNMAASLLKFDIILREELHNLEPMPRDPWEIVSEDLARFAEGEA